jgi:Fe-S cluster biogenesis protein NfuA/nitrite reductase/ring-hydroxylating ferredoxin subunit
VASPNGQVDAYALPGELLDRVQELTEQIDTLSDPRARELAQDLVAAVVAMYGDGLRRIIETIEASRVAGATILDQLAQDGAVASLLLIHDLYPVSLQDRVLEALDTVRPYMESHGGNVELLGIEDGVARLALRGSCNGCAASRATLELAIKQALQEHAPDLAGLEVSGVTEPAEPVPGALPMAPPGGGSGFELPVLQHGTPVQTAPLGRSLADRLTPRWLALAESSRPGPGALATLHAGGVDLLLADVGGTLLAYENACAACGEPLGDAQLDRGMLRCRHCEVEFDLPHAGRAAGGEPLQLRPIPLLESGGLRVAP